MKARLVQIGNSRGVRIPKPLLEQCGLTEEVDLSVKDDAIVIKASSEPRAGWEASFEAMAASGDDELLDPEAPLGTDWDEAEWQW